MARPPKCPRGCAPIAPLGATKKCARLKTPAARAKCLRQTLPAAFWAWFQGSQVIHADGSPRVVYHGTTGDFDTFDRERANPESDFGAGFYFTNSTQDVDANYAGEGPDLTSKIQQEAERIAGETDREYNDPDVVSEARAKFSTHGGTVLPVYLAIRNPFRVGGVHETVLTFETTYDDEGEFLGEQGTLVNFIAALRSVATQYNEGDVDDLISDLVSDGDSITASKLIESVSSAGGQFDYYTDNSGRLVSKEIIRQALARVGFDGIIDESVNKKFGSERRVGKSMVGMGKGTIHFIAFEPWQVKSAVGNRGTFDPNDGNILHGFWR